MRDIKSKLPAHIGHWPLAIATLVVAVTSWAEPAVQLDSLQDLSEAGATRVSLGSALQIKIRKKFTAEIEDLYSSGRAS